MRRNQFRKRPDDPFGLAPTVGAKDFTITEEKVRQLIEITDSGLGLTDDAEKLCVCRAIGQTLEGNAHQFPASMPERLSAFLGRINDSSWEPVERGVGLKRLAVASLCSQASTTDSQFECDLQKIIGRRIVPELMQVVLQQCDPHMYEVEEIKSIVERLVEPTSQLGNLINSLGEHIAFADSALDCLLSQWSEREKIEERTLEAGESLNCLPKVRAMLIDAALDILTKNGSPGCGWLHLAA